MIPVIPKIHKDEIVYSYIQRLAKANCFDDTEKFVNALLHKSRRAIYGLEFDASELSKITGISLYELITEHTTYPFDAIFVSRSRQSEYLMSASGLHDGINNFNTLDELKSCPECDKDGKYYRVFHNLKGVNVCPIHNVILTQKQPVKEEKGDYRYSQFALYLWRSQIFCNGEYLNGLNIVRKGRKKRNFTKDDVIKLMEFNSLKGNTEIPNPEKSDINEEYRIIKEGIITEYVHTVCGAHFVNTSFGFNAGYRCPVCLNSFDEERRYARILDDSKEYKLTKYGDYIKNCEVRHKPCGRTIKLSPTSYKNGIRCTCFYEISDEEIENSLPEGYQLIQRNGATIELKHLKCGQKFSVNRFSFAKNPYCRICEIKGNAAFRLEKLNPEYTYLYREGNYVYMLHEKCGNIVKRRYPSKLEHIDCEYCSGRYRTKLLLEDFVPGQIIWNEDYPDRTRELERLTTQGKLVSVCRGGRVLKGTAPTNKEIVFQKYVFHSGKWIGCLSGESFLEKIGYTRKADRMYIASNINPSYVQTEYTINGFVYRITKAVARINSRNHDAVEVAQFICRYIKIIDSNYDRKRLVSCIGRHIEQNRISLEEVEKFLYSNTDPNFLNKAKGVIKEINETEK